MLGATTAFLATVIAPCGAELHVQPGEVQPGGIARVFTDAGCQRLAGSLGGSPLHFFRVTYRPSPVALAGVDLDAPAGVLEIEVNCDDRVEHGQLKVLRHAFPTESLAVPTRYTRPSAAQEKRAAREAERLSRLWNKASPERLWRGRFERPARGRLGTPFGVRRTFNGEPRSAHNGIDLRAGPGSPVLAANRGRVVLRDDLFFSGKTVVLDHGLGLYTAYLHLSGFTVAEGELVTKGQMIGTVGATGRVTGPHLHFSSRLSGARVDPLQLITADLENVKIDDSAHRK